MKAERDSAPGAAQAQALSPDREMRIELWIDEWVQFEGTAAHLIAEGVIPAGFEWPRAAEDRRWTAGRFEYWLRRTRPDGHKGPKRSWLELDNWFIRFRVTGRDRGWLVRRHLERQAEALKAAYHQHTAAGSAECNANWKRYWATVEDKRFQAFKARVPSLNPPARTRKSKGAASANSA